MKNIRIYVATTAFLIGGSNINAFTLTCPKDNTIICNTAVVNKKYKSQRPVLKDRLYTSEAVEAEKISQYVRELLSEHFGNNCTLSYN